MSVLIEGMKMPKENPRTINIYRDGTWVDAYTTEDGKATEVPPHGRLIDADAFLALVNDTTILSDVVKYIINPLIMGEPTVVEAEAGEP